MFDRLDAFRRKVPYWWWLVYDTLVATLIAALFATQGIDCVWAWLGVVGLAFSITIDSIEYVSKRRDARPWRWKYACKHGYPNFVHCPKGCDD